MGDWSEIPADILVSIAKLVLDTPLDYLSLSQVCKYWSCITLSPHHHPLPQPLLLMLSESNKKVVEEEIHQCGFVGLHNPSKVYELHLPELHQFRCLGSTGNWLIITNKQLDVYVFNPYSKIQFQLLSQSTLPNQLDDDIDSQYIRDVFLTKGILSCTRPISNFVATVIYGANRRLAFARPGDESWIAIQSPIPVFASIVDDVIFFKNQFHSINRRGNVTAYDIDSSPPQVKQVYSDFKDLFEVDKYYLVEWLGKLLLVAKYCPLKDEEPHYKTERFEVHMFDFDNGELLEVKSLGKHSIFLGFNTSVSFLVSDSSHISRNCIYFMDDYQMGYSGTDIGGGRDMGVFDLENGTIKPHFSGISTSPSSPPLWIIPKSISS